LSHTINHFINFKNHRKNSGWLLSSWCAPHIKEAPYIRYLSWAYSPLR
jgi:hypothetical protein